MLIQDVIDFLNNDGCNFSFSPANENVDPRNCEIQNFSNLNEIEDNCICWIKNKKFAPDDVVKKLQGLNNILVVCPFEIENVNCIITDYPKGVIFSILNHFFSQEFKHEISPHSVILTKKIGKNVHIGPNCYIIEDVEIGDNTIINANVVIQCKCKIGHDCEIASGVVIGKDGYGYYMENDIPVRERHFKGVIIGDYVEIGANCVIDRGLLSDTVIGNHVKIDSLSLIAHNVKIEDNSMIVGGVLLGGSVVIKKNSYLSPGCIILNQLTVGENAKIGTGAVAMQDVPENVTIIGNPGRALPNKTKPLP